MEYAILKKIGLLNTDKLKQIENNPFFIEEINTIQQLRNGIEYYKYVFTHIRLDNENTTNSYIMWVLDKTDNINLFKPANIIQSSSSMPDIDMDVEVEFRKEILAYIKNKYGDDRVTQIITFQNMKGAKALSEVFRAYGKVSHEEVKRITKNIIEEHKITDELQEMQQETGESSIIRWCLENRAKQFADWCTLEEDGSLSGPYAKEFDYAIRLEGIKSAQSKHAAGVVIAPRPLVEICPMILDTKNETLIGGLTMNDMESVGLVKLDLLGLNFLDKMSIINKLNSEFEAFKDDKYDDLAVWNLLSTGKTLGIFQFESKLGQSSCKKLKPENLDQLAALSAALRPGCISEDTDIIIRINQDNNRSRLVKKNIKLLYNQFKNPHPLFRPDIISYDEINHCLVKNTITNMWFNGIKNVYKINFYKRKNRGLCDNQRQYNIECTDNHPLFVFNKGWVELKNLEIGDRFLILANGEGRSQLTRQKNNSFFWAEFAGTELVGPKEVYDIEVAGPNHSFIAGDTIVHNCMEALKEDGKSVTEHYIMKKNNLEPIEYIDEQLKPILQNTYGELIYQEEALHIAKELAGFTLSQANVLRKAIGKKKADLMAKMKTEFLEGIEKTKKVSKEIGDQLFEWIEKSQRYSFNACLSPNTIIELQNGEYKTLADVVVGDMIATPYGYNQVLNKFDNGLKEVYEITLENGRNIQCTIDHKFLCENGEVLPLYEILTKDLKICCETD